MTVVNFYKILFLSIALVYVLPSNAQTRKQLEAKRKRLKTEITKVNRLLFAAQKNEKNALEDLKDLNQKIAVRTAFIASIHKESSFLSTEINENQKEINRLTKKLKTLKKDYAEIIFKSYKSKSKQNRILFLLSSQSFQQAYKRLEYMKQYSSFQKHQGEEIVSQTAVIKSLNDSLLFKKQVKETLIFTEKEQKGKIELDKKNQEKLVSKIKKKEQRYVKEIRKKQQEEAKIAAQIDKIIKDAIAKSNKIKGKKLAKGNTSKKEFVLSPEAKVLAVQFQKNKGKLPWPVDEGLVIRRYGKQAHPTLRGITITSTGLHIATKKGGKAHSVFKGKVLAIQLLTGGKKAVLIQHGNYITTYNNLERVYVKKGDSIKTGQEIGKIFTNRVTGKTTLIFVVHKETQRQNPASWILKR